MTRLADAPILNAAAMRAAELAMVPRGVTLAELMQRAGRSLADMVWRSAARRPVLILCGPGNNGGDGYVAAQILAERGADVRVAASAPPSTELAQAAAAAWKGRTEALGPQTASAPVLVDAVFGTGMARPLAPELCACIGRLARAAQWTIAVDLPSGIATDSGACLSPVPNFDMTLAFGALKPAHILLPAAAHCGALHLAPIGIETNSPLRTLPQPESLSANAFSHKYSRGQVLVIAGPMAGAARLAASAALRSGAGHCLLSGAEPGILAVVADTSPLAERLCDPRLGAIVLGPGCAAGKPLIAQAKLLVCSDKPLVLDAAAIEAGLSIMQAAPRLGTRVILTPHAGEFDRFFGKSDGSKLDRTLAAARAAQSVIIHKGADTIIAAPDGRVAAAWPGCFALASAGTGDVLAGACGAMLAAGLPPFEAAYHAVAWQIAVARAIGSGLIADDLVAER